MQHRDYTERTAALNVRSWRSSDRSRPDAASGDLSNHAAKLQGGRPIFLLLLGQLTAFASQTTMGKVENGMLRRDQVA